jgi:hypothetical protein
LSAAAAHAARRGYERKFVKGGGDVPALKQEMLKVQESFGKDYVTIASAKKSDPRHPWPLSLTRTIERPAEYDQWDVEEMHLTIGVDRVGEKGSFRLVPFAKLRNHENLLPPDLVDMISAAVQYKWESLLRKRDAVPRRNAKSWALERVFDWADTQYGKFLRLVPSLVEAYLGTSSRGDSQRRCAWRGVAWRCMRCAYAALRCVACVARVVLAGGGCVAMDPKTIPRCCHPPAHPRTYPCRHAFAPPHTRAGALAQCLCVCARVRACVRARKGTC